MYTTKANTFQEVHRMSEKITNQIAEMKKQTILQRRWT